MTRRRRLVLPALLLFAAAGLLCGCSVSREAVRPPAPEPGEEEARAPEETLLFGVRTEELVLPAPAPPYAESDEIAGRWLRIFEIPAPSRGSGPVTPAAP